MSPTKTFIIWDFQLTSISTSLEELAKHPPEGVEVFVPGKSPGLHKGRVFEDHVRPRLDESDRVVVLADLPNANVGFELGYALGRGKPAILASVRRDLPDWLDGKELFSGHFVESAGGLRKLRRLVTNDLDEGEEAIESRRRQPEGDETLFLCALSESAEVYFAIRDRAAPNWRTLGETWPAWDKIPELLAPFRRVVWTLAPVHGEDEPRDGIENALASVVAGYAKATDRELVVIRDGRAGSRSVVDVKVGEVVVDGSEAYERKLMELASPGAVPAPGDALALYRAWLERKHAVFVPFFGTAERDLDEACVTLKVAAVGEREEFAALGRGEHESWRSGSLPLRELLEFAPNAEQGRTGCWSVLGDPGSGKSTACRRLCHQLAQEDDAPLPILVTLSAWVRRAQLRDPFDYVEALVENDDAAAHAGLADALRERAQQHGQVWLIFDGLDELTVDERKRFAEVLPGLIEAHVACRFLVTSRPTDYQAPADALVDARLQPLQRVDQDELLRRWIGPELAADMRTELDLHPRLNELAPNPLMLTFLAELYRRVQTGEDDHPLPGNRGGLYERAVKLLLERGREKDGRAVKSPKAAMRVLPELSLRLLRSGLDAWDEETLFDELDGLLTEQPGLERHLKRAEWTPEDFLEDLRGNAGLLGDHDGPGTPWRFLHRSLGEYLAAVALAARDEWGGEVDPIELLRDDEPRWGEVFALLAGRLSAEDPRRGRLLEELVASDSELALRTLPQIEGLSPEEAVGLLKRVEGWDGDHLRLVVRALLIEKKDEDAVRGVVLADVDEALPTDALAWRYYALESCGIHVDRAAFFRAAGRALPEGDVVEFLALPGGDFSMGSPPEEGGRFDGEQPVHRVRVEPFELARTPVTVTQYRRFEAVDESLEDDLPMVELSWWSAWLFSRWLNARLPSEAEWECACRAGTETPFSFAGGEDELLRHGWFFRNSGKAVLPEGTEWDVTKVFGEWRCTLQVVGGKTPNAWGLHDMHGNVFEWCQDRWAEQKDDACAVHPRPFDPDAMGSEYRVIRGGSFDAPARDARSAYRLRIPPSFRAHYLGFRPARAPRNDSHHVTTDPS